jgi:hypothetical protein
MKRFLSLALSSLLVPALAAAAIQARYAIQLRDGHHVFSNDLPVRRGSVVTFHQSPGGALTGLPAEDVVSIQTGVIEVGAKRSAADVIVRGHRTAIQTLAAPMQPGDMIILGPTGGGNAQVQNGNATAAASGAGNGPSTPPANNGYGGGYPYVPTAMGPNGRPIFTPQPGNTLSAQSSAPPTVAPNGFPVTTGNPPTIGPNGTPISSSDQPIIGANGTPVMAPAGTPDAAPPVIAPNGTPVMAQPGAPSAAQPVIGPNGTPVLAPAGAPGSAPPATAPNGTAAAPPPGGGASPK